MARLLDHGKVNLPQEYLGGGGPSLDTTFKSPVQMKLSGKPPVLYKNSVFDSGGADSLATKNSVFDSGGADSLASTLTPPPTPEVQRLCSATSDGSATPVSFTSYETGDGLDGEDSDCATQASNKGRPHPTSLTNSPVGRKRAPLIVEPLSEGTSGKGSRESDENSDIFSQRNEAKHVASLKMGVVEPTLKDITTANCKKAPASKKKVEDEEKLDEENDFVDIDINNEAKVDHELGLWTPTRLISASHVVEMTTGRRRSEDLLEKGSSEVEEKERDEDVPEDAEERTQKRDERKESKVEGIFDNRGVRSQEQILKGKTEAVIVSSGGECEEKKTEKKYSDASAVAVPMLVAEANASKSVSEEVSEDDEPQQGSLFSKVLTQGEAGHVAENLVFGVKAPSTPTGMDDADENKDDVTIDAKETLDDAKGTYSILQDLTPPPPPLSMPITVPITPEEVYSSSLSPTLALPHSSALSQSPPSKMVSTSAYLRGGLPLPPVGSGRQRFGLLGSLPPVGGKGLPSLSLGGEVVKGNTDAIEPNTIKDRTAAPQPYFDSLGSPVHAADGVASDAVRVSQVPPQEHSNDKGNYASDSLAQSPPSRNDEQNKKDQVAVLRSRLGFSIIGDEQKTNDDDSIITRASPSPLGSPKQHQGQEEENAGLTTSVEPRDVGGDVVTVKEVGAGKSQSGDYFGDSDEEVLEEEELGDASSVDEDISFEQEDSDGSRSGGAGGAGDHNDYFS